MNADNPYQPSRLGSSTGGPTSTLTTQLRWMLTILMVYYVVSSLTLPLADEIWLGELPLMAIPQLPKSWLFSTARQYLIILTQAMGVDRGSPSPNMIAMTPWAFAIVFIAPTALAIAATAICRRLRPCWPWIWRLMALATVDAVITIWFDQTSRLSIF